METLPTVEAVAPRGRLGSFGEHQPLLGLRRARQIFRNYRRLKRDFDAMRRDFLACTSLEQKVDVVRAHKVFGAIQRHNEITGLLRLLEQNPPRCVCEIGTASGGNLFMLAQISRPDALLVGIDLDLTFERSRVHAKFARRKQRIVSIRGDSHAPETAERVRLVLKSRPLDLLFIDGDHSYEGVKADFANYRPLVGSGGLIVFHDIVADFGTRHGTPTGTNTGGVPVFWQELKAQYRTSEIIEDAEQDGFGIGIVHVAKVR